MFIGLGFEINGFLFIHLYLVPKNSALLLIKDILFRKHPLSGVLLAAFLLDGLET